MCFQSKEFELLPSIKLCFVSHSHVRKDNTDNKKNAKKTTKRSFNFSSLGPLQAVLDNNLVVVQLLLRHGAQIDQKVIH